VRQGRGTPEDPRTVWQDHERRQEFEHGLIDRKTNWLLTAEGLLFTAYGFTFQGTPDQATTGIANPDNSDLANFRDLVAMVGLSIAAIGFLGVIGLLASKVRAWEDYELYFKDFSSLPGPLKQRRLQWGVRNSITWFTVTVELAIPVVLVVVWLILFVTVS
jgi:hypothetical protein